jgi:A/G-specific adenine glycosylase
LSAEPLPVANFARRLIDWQRAEGRHDLPWQNTRDPYRIWLSEIMLQQTQVATVVPYYLRFVERFPTVAELAAADEDTVLALWSGLGYYSRARNLHAAARDLMAHHGGRFPRTAHALAQLPGIGPSTAAAIAAFAYGERAAILDGNVKRVLARTHGIREPLTGAVERRLWRLAQALLPEREIEAYTQGLMDLGATLCTPRRPDCARCPLREDCTAFAAGDAEALPAKAPKRAASRVRRECHMLLMQRDGRWLLVKRPPAGVWASLWCFPEYVSFDALKSSAEPLIDQAVLKPQAPVRHSFTHFELTVHPVHAHGRWAARAAMQADHRWAGADEIARLGVPSIVGKLLAQAAEDEPLPAG